MMPSIANPNLLEYEEKVGAERRELLPMHHDSSSRSDALGDHVGRSGAASGAASDVIRARHGRSRPRARARRRHRRKNTMSLPYEHTPVDMQ